jgi:hypothetical protein
MPFLYPPGQGSLRRPNSCRPSPLLQSPWWPAPSLGPVPGMVLITSYPAHAFSSSVSLVPEPVWHSVGSVRGDHNRYTPSRCPWIPSCQPPGFPSAGPMVRWPGARLSRAQRSHPQRPWQATKEERVLLLNPSLLGRVLFGVDAAGSEVVRRPRRWLRCRRAAKLLVATKRGQDSPGGRHRSCAGSGLQVALQALASAAGRDQGLEVGRGPRGVNIRRWEESGRTEEGGREKGASSFLLRV